MSRGRAADFSSVNDSLPDPSLYLPTTDRVASVTAEPSSSFTTAFKHPQYLRPLRPSSIASRLPWLPLPRMLNDITYDMRRRDITTLAFRSPAR